MKQALDDLALAYSVLDYLPEMLMLVLRPKGQFRIRGKHTIQSKLGLCAWKSNGGWSSCGRCQRSGF